MAILTVTEMDISTVGNLSGIGRKERGCTTKASEKQIRTSIFSGVDCYEFGTESLTVTLLGARHATLPRMKRFLSLAIGLSMAITVLAAPKANDGVALFRVTRVESTIVMSSDSTRSPRETLPDVSLVPIAVIEGGRWTAPASTGRCTDANKWDAFEKNYLYGVFAYHMGTQRGPLGINVLRGEKKAAAIVATMRMPLLSSFQERAIAANSDKLGRQKTNQKAANKEDTAEFLNVARGILSVDIKTPEAELAKLRVERPIVTDFGTRKNVMIRDSCLYARHDASRIVPRDRAGKDRVKPMLADYRISDLKKGNLAIVKFVDQLDVDGDGIDEIFADVSRTSGYTSDSEMGVGEW